jgi:hypothetical protein
MADVFTYKQAEEFVEQLAIARRSISVAVDSARLQQKAERLELDYRLRYKDPTAKLVINDLTPLAVVRCFHENQPFIVYQPEKWLKVIQEAFNLFRQRFGDGPYMIIKHRFIRGWSTKHIMAVDGVSLQTYSLRRQQFLAGLLVLAAQNGLIRIDSSLPKDK